MGRITPRVDTRHAANALSLAIAQKTYGQEPLSPEALAPFLRLHAVLKEAYPLLFARAVVHQVHQGGLLLFLSGGHSADPLLFLSHMDVVPAEDGPESEWEFPPFSGALADGFVWGRGAADMKGHMIALMEAAESLLAAGWQPSRDVWLALSCDEEIRGGCGAEMLKILTAQGVRPAFVLDEGGFITNSPWPGMEQPVALIGVMEKGLVNYQLCAKDEGGHASRPPRKTAAARVAGAAARAARRERGRLTPPVREMLRAFSPRLKPMQRFITAHPSLFWPIVRHNLQKSRLGDALLRTTLAVTMLSGSQAPNALPMSAQAVVNCRLLPGDTVRRATARLERRIHDRHVTLTPLTPDDPSAMSPASGPAWEALATAFSILRPDVAAAPYLMVGGTDARRYEELSHCVYRISPFVMPMEEQTRLHSVNERLSLENLELAIQFFQQMLQA